MIFLIISIFCSVSVGVLLKYARRYDVSVPQIVNLNYVFAILLSYLAFSPQKSHFKTVDNWIFYLILSLLLPSIFIFMARSIRFSGIVKTDIAQRLSLFIPILVSYFIFGEQFSNLKLIGLLIGFTAIFFTLHRKNESDEEKKNWFYPLIVLFGFGIIDVFFKQIAVNKVVPFTSVLFIVFCLSLVVATSISAYYLISGKMKLQRKSILWGALLGILNFGNIYFYLKSHSVLAENPSTVFATMNFGVIALGSCVGVLLFKEKITKINYIGITLALTAVIIITASQLYAI